MMLSQTAGGNSLDNLPGILNGLCRSAVPGLQYVVVDAADTLFDYAGGWAGIRDRQAMTPDTTLMAYSMTKTITAIAILQLTEQALVELDGDIDEYLEATPYVGRRITVRQLLDHTSGIANPIPLRWVHMAADDSQFDESSALAEVLRSHPKLAAYPGVRFAYSNVGYWLLGKIVERATRQSYRDYVREKILIPLNLSPRSMGFEIRDPARHATGYLARYSLMNLLKGFLTDKALWGGYEGEWLRLRSHYVNGPAFGGLVGSARAFSRFLQDQLHPASVLLRPQTKGLLESQQSTRNGKKIPMTLGWHLGETRGTRFFFKEGGGGGFHCEMRLYPQAGVGSVVMVNSAQFNTTRFLNRFDAAFCGPNNLATQ